MALGVLRQSLGLAWLISLQLVALLIALLQEIFPAARWQISEIYHNFADIEASGSVFWFVLGVLLISFSIFYYRTYLITISSFLKLGKGQMFKFSLIHFVFFSIFVTPFYELGESVRESQESKEGLLYEIMIFVDGPIKKYLPF